MVSICFLMFFVSNPLAVDFISLLFCSAMIVLNKWSSLHHVYKLTVSLEAALKSLADSALTREILW